MGLIGSLNRLRRIRLLVTGARRQWLVHVRGIVIAPSASLSLSARLVCPRAGAIRIGEDSLVAFKTLLLAGANEPQHIVIGARCFIGGGATILPGVRVGDGSIVGAGAIVGDDVPPDSIVAGNPARLVRTGINAGRYGRLPGADDATRAQWTL